MSFIGKILFHVGAIAIVLWAIESYVLPESFAVIGSDWWAYGVAAFVFGVFNFWVKPFIKIAMLPINVITLGFASLAVNGVLLFGMQYVLSTYDVYGVTLNIEGWMSYLIAGIVLGLANTVIHWIS